MPTPHFIHIPKTAGSSIRTLLTLNYLAHRTISIYQYEHMWELCRSATHWLKRPVLVQGHMGWGAHLFLGNEDPWYFTFLRDPTARHLSDVAHGVVFPQI